MVGSAFIRSVRAALRTTTGTQDFTVSGAGTCVGYRVTLTRGITDGTVADSISLSKGAHDGTRSLVMATSSQDAAANSKTSRILNTTHVGLVVKADATGYDVRVKHSAYITDGVRIDVAATDGVAYLCEIELFFGADVQLYVSTHNMANGAVDATEDVTAPGFEPTFAEFLFCDAVDTADPPTAPTAGVKSSYGLACNNFTGVSQTSITYSHNDNGATATPTSDILPSTVVAASFPSVAALSITYDWQVGLDSWLSNGFRLKNILGGNPDPIGYIAVRLGRSRASLGLYDSPTSVSGTITITPGWTPWSALIMSTATVVGPNAGAQAGAFGFGFAAQQGEEFSAAQNEQDSAATMNNGVQSDDDAIKQQLASGIAGLQATASWSSTQFILTFSAVQGTARKQAILVLEKDINQGTFSVSQSSRTAAFVANTPHVGTFAISQSSRVVTAAALLRFLGAATALQSARSAIFEARVPFAGTFSVSQSSRTAASVALLRFVGTFDGTQSARVADFVGANTNAFSGSFSASQGARTAAFVAPQTFRATFAGVQGSRTAAFTGVAGDVFVATFEASQSARTAAFAGELEFVAAVAATQGPRVAAMAASLVLQGSFAGLQGSRTAAFTGLEVFFGSFAGAQGARVADFAGTVPALGIQGTFSAAQSARVGAFTALLPGLGSRSCFAGSSDIVTALLGAYSSRRILLGEREVCD